MSSNDWSDAAATVEETTPLSGRQAEVLTLKRLTELSRDEIAAELDIAPNTVDRHLEEARAKLEQARRAAREYVNAIYCEKLAEQESLARVFRVFATPQVSGRLTARSSTRPYLLEIETPEGVQASQHWRKTVETYQFEDPRAVLDSIRSEAMSLTFEEVAGVYSVFTEAFDRELPSFVSVSPDEPTEREVERVVSSNLVSFEAVQPYLNVEPTADACQMGMHVGTEIPVDFDVCQGTVTCVRGMLGAGMEVTAPLLTHRTRRRDDAPTFVLLSLFESSWATEYVETTTGQCYTGTRLLDGGVPDAAFEDLLHVMVDATDEIGERYHTVLKSVLNRAEALDTDVCVVADQAHVLQASSQRLLMEAANDEASPLVSWVYKSYDSDAFDEFVTANDISVQENGFILHKQESVAGVADDLTLEQRDFVYNANSGKGNGANIIQALASPPGEKTWRPMETRVREGEETVISR